MSIIETRAELAAALEPIGVTVYSHAPERFTPPAALVVHGSPLMEAGDSFGSRTLRFEVWVVSKLGANARMTTDLDELIDSTLDALAADSWTVENVSQPFDFAVNAATYLSATITVSTNVSTN